MHAPGQALAQNSAPVALAIHGAGAGGWEFNLWRWRFQAAGWVLHAPDLQPRQPLEHTRLDDYLLQVQHCCELLRPALLIGASLGGLLALLAQPQQPGLPRVLINPLPPAPWSQSLGRSWPARVDWAHRHDHAGTLRALGSTDTVSARFAQQRWRDESGAVLNDAAAATLDGERNRTLLIAGTADQDVPSGTSHTLAQALDADYLELPGAGHVDPLCGAQAQQVLDQVLAWVERQLPQAGTAAAMLQRG